MFLSASFLHRFRVRFDPSEFGNMKNENFFLVSICWAVPTVASAIRSRDPIPLDDRLGEERNGVYLDGSQTFFDRCNQSGRSGAQRAHEMNRVFGELFSKVFVWFALLGNGASIDIPPDPFSFEPRDSRYKNKTTRKIEVLTWSANSTEQTPVPIELVPPIPSFFEAVCETCPECWLCTARPYRVAVPEVLWYPNYIIFHSIRGDNVYDELLKYLNPKSVSDRQIWRAGLAPLRVWVKDCTVIVSMFSGSFPVCNCDPPPNPYQLLIDGFQHMFHRAYVDVRECGSMNLACNVRVKAPVMTISYTVTSQTNTLLLKHHGPSGYLTTPAFDLALFQEPVTHILRKATNESVKETFFAVTRNLLEIRASRVLEKHQNRVPMLADVLNFFPAKLKGTPPHCFKIGKKNQTLHSFAGFESLVKV